MTTTEFPSLEAFYNDRPERRTSGEADYGVHWRIHRCHWPLWRVSYIQATGEIYAVQQHDACPVRVLGVIPPDPDERTNGAERVRGTPWAYENDLGRGTYYRTLDGILEGWSDPDVSGHDLAWITRKLAAA